MRRRSAGRVHDSLPYIRSAYRTEIKVLFHSEGGHSELSRDQDGKECDSSQTERSITATLF